MTAIREVNQMETVVLRILTDKSYVLLRPQVRLLFRILASGMILVLLCVRLGSLREEVFSTPVEDAIFYVAFVSTENKWPQTRPMAIKYKSVLDCNLQQYEMSIPCPVPTAALLWPYIPLYSPRDVAFEIFIPPEATA